MARCVSRVMIYRWPHRVPQVLARCKSSGQIQVESGMAMRTPPSFLQPDKARKQQTGINTARKGMKPVQIEVSMARPWIQE